MDRPLCPLCNTKHFAREPHAFGIGGPAVKPDVPRETVPPKIPEKIGVGVCPTCGHVNRREWMRLYMKAYRARLKAREV